MPGIATGEAFSFAEGRIWLYASASGTTSGSGIGFARDTTLRFAYGYRNERGLKLNYFDIRTGQRAELSIGALYADRTLVALIHASAPVNVRFVGIVTGVGVKSAEFALYSGAVDSFSLLETEGQVWKATYGMHANSFSAFGQ